MKKARDHAQRAEVPLSPEARTCPGCQQPRAARYRQQRYIITRRGELKVISPWLAWRTRECPWRGARLRLAQEAVLALRGERCGLDVVAHIGEFRYREHRPLAQIQQALAVRIALQEVDLLSEVFLALVATHARDDAPRLTQ